MSGELIPGAADASPVAERADSVRAEAAAKGWMQSKALGTALGCSDETIRNWRKAGMKAAAVDGDGGHWFDVAACQAWRRVNRPGFSGKGGRRVGAGRKNAGGKKVRVRRGTRGGASSYSLLHSHPTSDIGHPTSSGEDSPRRAAEVAEGDVGEGETHPRFDQLHPTQQAEIRLKEAALREKNLKMDQQMGKLLPVDEVVAKVASVCATVRERLETIPTKAAPRLMSMCVLDPGMGPGIITLLGEMIDEAINELGAMKMGGESGSPSSS